MRVLGELFLEKRDICVALTQAHGRIDDLDLDTSRKPVWMQRSTSLGIASIAKGHVLVFDLLCVLEKRRGRILLLFACKRHVFVLSQ